MKHLEKALVATYIATITKMGYSYPCTFMVVEDASEASICGTL